LVALSSTSAFAYRAQECAQKVWMKRGFFREYDVKYSRVELISLKTSSDEGSFKVSTASSLQESTMFVDPGITTGEFEASTQFSSSYGDCALWLANKRWMRREHYISENLGSLRKDIAKGRGERLDVLAYLSGCSSASLPQFSNRLQSRYDSLFHTSAKDWELSFKIDRVIAADAMLSSSCGAASI